VRRSAETTTPLGIGLTLYTDERLSQLCDAITRYSCGPVRGLTRRPPARLDSSSLNFRSVQPLRGVLTVDVEMMSADTNVGTVAMS
jgi:hypothetical protein